MIEVNKEVISKFLQGRNPQKFIVAVEATYFSNKVDLIINHPKKGKYIETDTFKPFIWMRHDVGSILYNGNRKETRRHLEAASITIESLKIKDGNGNIPERLDNGYKYLLTGNQSYNQLLKFLKDGGVDVFGNEKEYFQTLAPAEQYLIQTGKRLFKGMEDYNDVHRLQFDLETTGLLPKKDRIFQIGIKDNRGFEHVLEVTGDTPKELRDNELKVIKDFFGIIEIIKPDIIAGYNSENFDFDFLKVRAEILGCPLKELDVKTSFNEDKSIYFKENASIKLGSETEYYNQTIMWGFNVIDIAHAVRRAQAINSSIKKWGLKYITKFSGIAKNNRVYVPGDVIHKVWNDNKNKYAFNEDDGTWYKIRDDKPIQDNYSIVDGAFIVRRYLLDDLWETEQIDFIYNQASFLLSKILPTSYSKTSTMGTASIWKLIMCAWSYENRLGIPSLDKQKTFTGGLSRLLEVGFAKNVAKLDYAALYPNIELTHNIFPSLDISNAMKNFLLYIAETRDEYKDLKNINDELAKLEVDPNKKKEYTALKSLYDKKQLPLKILANSFFGSFGAPYLFPWGDTDCAEETTCRGRQYFRLLVKFFKDMGFRPLVGDTDGVNFAIPDDIDKITYTSDGTHRFNKSDKEYTGLSAVVAEFNDLYMEGRMGLDVDEIALTTINFSRKNYADLLLTKNGETEVKLVGNSIKSKKMPGYIEDFIDKSVRLLLEGDGYGFIEFYYETVEKIYSYDIPLVKIASKSRVKNTIETYKAKSIKTNKAGNPLPKQAHMELLINEGIVPDLGDTIYYVNVGTSKSHGDLKTSVNKETGKKEIVLNCKLIPTEQIENNPELTTDEYNVPKYLDALNKKVKPLLVCFKPDIRNRIIINMVKDKVTKKLVLNEREYFTKKDTELCAGLPYNDSDQDNYEDLMVMEDKEIYFWVKMESKGIYPNNISKQDFEELKLDYITRMREKRNQDIIEENNFLNKTIRTLELRDLKTISKTGKIPEIIMDIVDLEIINNDVYFVSKNLKDDEVLCLTKVNYGLINDVLFKYENDAIKRAEYYKTIDLEKCLEDKKDVYDMWLEYIGERESMGLTKLDDENTVVKIKDNNISGVKLPNTIVDAMEYSDNEIPINIDDTPIDDGDDEWNF